MPTVKLRDSCDRCAADKVKCGKQRPVCQRCSRTRRTCVYGISQRSGKPARAKCDRTPTQSVSNGTTAAARSPPPANLTPPYDCQPGTPNLVADFWTSPDRAVLPGLPWQDAFTAVDVMPSTCSDPPVDNALSTNSTWPLVGETSWTIHSRNPSEPFIPLDPLLQDATDLIPASPSLHKNHYLPASSDFDEPCCCHLERFSERIREIAALSRSDSMTLDSFLHRITTISERVNASLRCTCSKNHSLLLFLAASSFEILVLYQAIANIDDPGLRPARRTGSTQLNLADSELTVGTFKLDAKTCSAVRDQLVLSQLQEMRDRWGEYIDSLSQNRAKAVDGIRLHLAVTDVMLAKLNSTMEKIESRRRVLVSRCN